MRSFMTSIFDLAEHFAPAPSGLLSLPGPKQKQRGLRGRDSCRALGNLLGLKRQRSELRAGRTAGPTSQRQRRHREVSPRLALVFLLRHLLLNCAGQEDKEGKVTEEKSGTLVVLQCWGDKNWNPAPTKEEAPQERSQSLLWLLEGQTKEQTQSANQAGVAPWDWVPCPSAACQSIGGCGGSWPFPVGEDTRRLSGTGGVLCFDPPRLLCDHPWSWMLMICALFPRPVITLCCFEVSL